MTERSDVALAALRSELEALEQLVGTLGEAEWATLCADEGWPVGLVAFHVARGFARQAEFVEDALDGRGPHRFSWAETHALNAAIAAHPAPTRDDVVALAERSVARIAAAFSGLTDGELDRVAFVHEGQGRSILWVVGRLAVQHARGHRESIVVAIS